jgi:thiol-disulfide isomerase/thioredoxin
MHEIIGFNDLDNFIIENSNSKNVLMLYFGAPWCGPCKQLKTRLSEPETNQIMPDLVIAHIDVDEDDNEKLIKRYEINSLPTQIFIKLEDNNVVIVSSILGYDFTKLKLEYDNYNIIKPT